MFGVQTILSALLICAIPSPQDATLLFTTTPGCGPCAQVAPLVEQLAKEGYSVETIDASKHPELIRQLGVDRFPTFLMYSGDRIVDRVVGGGDPIVLKPRIMQMYDRAVALKSKERSTSPLASTLPLGPEPVSAPVGAQTGSAFMPAVHVEPKIPASQGNVVPVSFVSPGKISAAPSAQALPQPSMSLPVSSEVSSWITSSVKLRVDASNTHSWGTGTIIDTRQGEALILTCGHIFRDSQGQGQIEVHLFGQQSSVKVFGRCIYYDLEIDLALVVIAPPCPVRAIPIAPVEYQVRAGQSALSVGCDNGANPSVRSHQIISTDRIGTPLENAVPFHYIQISGAPVSGRSGGGLFTQDGYLIGVCNTADPVENDGHFVPPHIIRHVMQKMQLNHIYENPSLASELSDSSSQVVVQEPKQAAIETLSQDDMSTLLPLTSTGVSDSTAASWQSEPISNVEAALLEQHAMPELKTIGMNDTEKATLDEIRRRAQDGDEVILIVRSRRNPEIPSDVIVLNGTSDQFIDALSKHTPSVEAPSYNPVILSSHDHHTVDSQNRPVAAAQPGPRQVSFPVVHSP